MRGELEEPATTTTTAAAAANRRFKVTQRGTLRQLLHPDGTPVEAPLYGCRVIKPPYTSNGKTYMLLDHTGCTGDLDVVKAVDDFIRATARPAFTPLATGTLLVKLTRATKYETAGAVPGFAFTPSEGQAVDVVVGPGAFGTFGYCVLVKRMKPGGGGAV